MYFLNLNRSLLRTNSVSSDNFVMHESPSVNASPRSSSPAVGWTIQYKPIRKTTPKGVWDGYQTKEEFMLMHLR